jgi:oxidoreductase
MPSALVLGATGAVGKHILSGLLASPEYTRVGEFGRRVTAIESPPENLIQRTIPDFDKIEEVERIKDGWDVVIIA